MVNLKYSLNATYCTNHHYPAYWDYSLEYYFQNLYWQ